jgi:hypothetical protein
MRKMILSVVLTIGMIGSTFAQLAIPGLVFADNPSRFNGRKVTLKNVVLKSNTPSMNSMVISPLNNNGPINIGSIGPVTQTRVLPCRPPRGFSEVEVYFTDKPEFEGCFFMSVVMYQQLQRELGGQNVDAKITFRGDHRTGYNLTFYRLGK